MQNFYELSDIKERISKYNFRKVRKKIKLNAGKMMKVLCYFMVFLFSPANFENYGARNGQNTHVNIIKRRKNYYENKGVE